MARKLLRKKIKVKNLPSTPKVWRYLIQYISSVLSVWLIVVFSIVFFPSQFLASIPCANSITCAKDLSVKIENNVPAEYMGKKIQPPVINLANDILQKPTQVLGSETSGEKKIFVDLSQQKLFAYQGNTLLYTFDVSTGLWYPTPTGNFNIWVKLRSTRMTGGDPSIGTYYDLPNVEYTMFFYNDSVPKDRGFSLHAAYWHNNFGHPMSHGCINMRRSDAKKLYEWADPQVTGYTTYATKDNPGTQVTIYGVAPKG